MLMKSSKLSSSLEIVFLPIKNQVMKQLLFILSFLLTSSLFSQNIKFKVSQHKDTSVFLVRYYGKGQYYADTADLKGGIVSFDGTKHEYGVYSLFIPGKGMLDFIHNGEEIYIETKVPDMTGSALVKKSEENKIFIPYIRFMNDKRTLANRVTEQRKGHEEGSEQYAELSNQLKEINKEVVDYQNQLISGHQDKFVSKLVFMSMDVKIPDSPKDENGKIIDSTFQFNYFREHFFDHFDLKDDRIVRTPVYHNKLAQYFGQGMMVQHWDTIIHYAFDFCDRLVPGSDLYEYSVSWITSTYEKSNIMGMDKVFVFMGERYYCNIDEKGEFGGKWIPEEKLKTLCDKVKVQKNLVMGVKPPNITLRDTTDVTWRDFYSLPSEYTILYFWDPECGHCKKETPKLQTLYAEKFRDRNVEIFAVGKAVGEDFEKWKAFIHKNGLEFINVAVTDKLYKAALEDPRQFVPQYTSIESLNYQSTYDIYATPKIFILDKDKKIIAKSLSIAQLEEFIDRLQGKKDLEKIFKIEDEKAEDKIH